MLEMVKYGMAKVYKFCTGQIQFINNCMMLHMSRQVAFVALFIRKTTTCSLYTVICTQLSKPKNIGSVFVFPDLV